MRTVDKHSDPIVGYNKGVLAAFKLIQARVNDGESLAQAVGDDLPRHIYEEYNDRAYLGMCEVFSWLNDLRLEREDEEDGEPLHEQSKKE